MCHANAPTQTTPSPTRTFQILTSPIPTSPMRPTCQICQIPTQISLIPSQTFPIPSLTPTPSRMRPTPTPTFPIQTSVRCAVRTQIQTSPNLAELWTAARRAIAPYPARKI
jgi:hypothetical protein